VPRSSLPALCFLLTALPAAAGELFVFNAASYSTSLAPETIATAFGSDLATASGIKAVAVQDSAGVTHAARLLFAYPQQIAFTVPAGTATGAAVVTVTSGAGNTSTATVQISAVAPGLFAANANGRGVAAGIAVQGQNGSSIFACGSAGCMAVPVRLDGTVLKLYGTGIRRHSPSGVTCAVGGTAAPVLFAGPDGQDSELDRVDVSLPDALANRGLLDIVLTVDGAVSNTVTINTNGADVFVAPNGNDLWSGALPAPNPEGTDGPFASVARAQQAIRRLMQSGPPRPLTVMLRGGTYYLPLSSAGPGGLDFAAGDSGTSSAPVTWENYRGETPVISGGELVGKGGLGLTWENVSGSLWQVRLPEGTQPFEHLYYNGERRLRSRVQSPSGVGYYMAGGSCRDTSTNQVVDASLCNAGTFLRIAGTVPPTGANAGCPSATGTATQGSKCLDRFAYDPADPIASWENLNPGGSICGGASNSYPAGDVEVIIFEAWTMEVMRVSCVDTANHVIYLTGKMQGGGSNGAANTFNSFGPTKGHRYIVENTKDAFLAAQSAGQTGIWFLDRSSSPWTLNYLANRGEDPNQDTVLIAQAQPASPTGGSLMSASNIEYLTFRGITFEVDNYVPPPAGFSSDVNNQTTLPEAIDCESCRHVVFDGITVRHTSASGILIASASGNSGAPASDCVIQNSAFYDIGASGIRIGHQPAISDNAANVAQNILVYNNIVQGYGRVFAAGEGIAEGNGHDITYLHNDITDGYHGGIAVCSVNCNPYTANANNIVTQYNHIWNIMQGLTSDVGTLYYNTGGVGGAGTGNMILNNLVHDTTDSSIIDKGVVGSAYGGEGIYLDNLSAGVEVANNVVFRVSARAALMSVGPAAGQPANTFRNNIFAYARQAMYTENLPWANVGCANPSLRVNFLNNIFYFDRDDTSGFYVYSGCAWSCGLNYNDFQNFQGNLYWRTDGGFATYSKAFHVLTHAPADASTCANTQNPAMSWTFLTFAQWQNGTPPNGVPAAMNEDAGGIVTVDPGFGNTGQPTDFLLSANPMPGFDYTKTNDTILHAGRDKPVIMPPPVPATFPTYRYTDF
jgi:uncharacterized protein (TIGR03437 family)